MKYIDPYSITMLVLTLGLLVAVAFTGNVALLDLLKVSVGVTFGTLAKKAETYVVVSDPTTSHAILKTLASKIE